MTARHMLHTGGVELGKLFDIDLKAPPGPWVAGPLITPRKPLTVVLKVCTGLLAVLLTALATMLLVFLMVMVGREMVKTVWPPPPTPVVTGWRAAPLVCPPPPTAGWQSAPPVTGWRSAPLVQPVHRYHPPPPAPLLDLPGPEAGEEWLKQAIQESDRQLRQLEAKAAKTDREIRTMLDRAAVDERAKEQARAMEDLTWAVRELAVPR